MPHTLRQIELNNGSAQSKNLMESLSIDFNILIPSAITIGQKFKIDNSLGITKRMLLTSQWIYQHTKLEHLDYLKKHNSDTIRGLACYLIAHTSKNLSEKIELMSELANDSHYGVREWAWLALRTDVAHDPIHALHVLQPLTQSSHENIRRFASEVTRPRGVWCSHIPILKEQPWLGLSLIESLNDDPSRYVQLSVGNWLNDAGKNHKAWVQKICAQWLLTSPSKNTQTICKRALRNVKI